MKYDNLLQIGTCSWKYESWKGLVYSKGKPANYLQEYSSSYSTVEIDQWFWSLFAGDTVVMPKAEVVAEYLHSVPEDFKFAIKVPNSITLTHHYSKNKAILGNPHFLSVELMDRFLESIKPLWPKLGPLIFQFEYLNKQKMVNQNEFLDRFGAFAKSLPKNFLYTIETRNPNYLNNQYFDFLLSMKMSHVFLQGYYMPSIFEVYKKHRTQIVGNVVIRLHGPDRKEIEEITAKKWDKRIAPKEKDLDNLVDMLAELNSRKVLTYLYVNNHFEGSAPRTIARLEEKLA
jgi:uncharacterized protein YecE (DUF72 family)